MHKQIFVNFPVNDLPASIAFYRALGFSLEPGFTDDTAACMVWSDTIFAMLLTHPKWRSFTTRPLPPAGSTGVMLALSLDSRAAVDAMNDAAASHGGQADVNPVQDLGFMYGRDLADPAMAAWLAVDGATVVGFALAGPCKLPHDAIRPGDGEVRRVYVARAAQGRGIGRQLMHAAESFAREHGLGEIELETRIELVENHATFAALGFRKVAEQAHPGYDRPTSITMRKALPGA